MKYTQVKLKKENSGITIETTTFVPQKYARLGKVLSLKNEQKTWEGGWEVVALGVTLDEKDMIDPREQIKSHRQMTGDSLPKK